ncbi:hypothetical protein [Endozoicomonas sp. ONNA1]|uniref:hypothetical protein n=1 Tax=Endozoicomonas sp. ONNA1 TaxID=2828740 RepID=UPI00214811A4|nr:hypothetical protein [Endozoicomonas sp. ONNA1]
MNKSILFEILNKKTQTELLNLLDNAWETMSTNQRDTIFSGLMSKEQFSFPASADHTLKAVKAFQKCSLDGDYYAPFDINSRNYMDIPEETDAWFAKLDELFIESTKLVRQEEYQVALECFNILYELLEGIVDDEIIFADELGSWMFTGDEKAYFTAYIQTAAATCSDEDFVDKAIFALHEDSDRSCSLKLYSVIKTMASSLQMAMVDQQVKARKIKVA